MPLISRTPYFSPLNVSGCVLWLDGMDPAGTRVIPSTGATVSTWIDKSTSAKNATAGGTPTYVSGGGINFNGSSYFTNLSFAQNLSQRSIFIVMQETTRTAVGGVFPLIPTPSSGNDYDSTGLSIETQNGLRFYNGSGYQSDIGNTSLLVKAVYNDNMDVRAGTGFVNGNSATTVTASYTAGTCSGYGIGARWLGGINLTYSLRGVIFEIMFFNRPLVLAERRQIEGYLAQKWSLTVSLPAGHPGLVSTLYNSNQDKKITWLPMTRVPYYKVYNPQTIPGLILWLDGMDPNGTGARPANGTTLTTWKDKSVSNFSFTSVGSSYNTTAINGNPGINIGTNFFGYDPGSAQNNWQEVFAVGIWTGGSVFNNFNGFVTTSINSDGGFGGGVLFTADSNTTNWYAVGNTYTTPVINGTQTYTALPAASSPFQVRISSPTAVNLRGLRFGIDRSFTDRIWQGFISEVICCNTALSTTQRQEVESYLAQKWGLTSSLPVGHPSFTFPVGAPARGIGKQDLSFLPRASAPVVVTTNLITSLDAVSYTSGSTWTALTGNNYTITGTLTTASSAVVFDGSSYAQDRTGITSSTMYSFTLDVWFYAAANATGSVIGELGQVGLGGWELTLISISTNTISVGFWTGAVYKLSVGSYTANTWTHVSFSYNASTNAVIGYVNGLSVSTGTATKLWPTTVYLTTGGRTHPNTIFTGRIGAFKVYNSVLSAADIKQNYNALAGRYGLGLI